MPTRLLKENLAQNTTNNNIPSQRSNNNINNKSAAAVAGCGSDNSALILQD